MKTKFFFTFLLTQIFVAFVSWCGGYDFDVRSGYVALVVLLSALGGLFLSAVIATELLAGESEYE